MLIEVSEIVLPKQPKYFALTKFMDFHHESEASRTTSLSLLVPILRVTLRIMVFLYLLICIISVAFALKSKIRHMMAISTTKINLAQDNVGKIYEFKGPVSSGQGIPSEIAKMFDLSKGRKIRKGTTFGSGGSRRSSSSGKKKSSGPDEIQYGAEDSDFDSLERSLMTKYGSKSVKESALEKGFVDEPFQKTPSRGKQKFEGFGASNPETGIKSKSTNTIKSKPRNDDIDNNGGFLRESRTMDRSGQPVSADTRKISTLGNQKSAGRNIDDLEQGFRQVAKKVEPKEISGRVNTNIVKKREALASQSKNNPFKMSKPFFKDDVIDNSNEVGVKVEDDIYEDEDDSIFEDDGDDGFDLDDLDSFYDDDNSEKKESKSIKQSQTKAPVAIRQELPRTGSKNSKSQASTKSASTSSDSRANRDVDSRFDVVAEPTYRLRSPPVAPPQTPEQQRVASEIKRKADEREVRQEAERKERKIQAKNDFIPFQFEDNQASVRSEEGMKLFSTTSTFQSLGISNEIILKNLEQEMHIGQPTRIQELAIPSLLEGKDAIIQAHTGSGE